MSEWWTYRLHDFVLFAPATWTRLFERYHAALWPAQAVVLALGVLLLVCALQRRGRALALGLAAAGWLWVGAVFHAQWFTPINWAAPALAVAAALQAALLAIAAASRGGWAARGARRHAGLLLLAVAVVVGPCLRLAGVRAEVFGLTPDATALGTLGLLLCVTTVRPALAACVWPVPLVMVLIGLATAWALQA